MRNADFAALAALLIRLAFAAIGTAIAAAKNRSRVGWFIGCLIFSWMGVLVIAVMPKRLSPDPGPPAAIIPQAVASAAPVDSEEAARLDRIGRNVDSMFDARRGPVAQMKGGRVIAQAGSELRTFDYLADYRRSHNDHDTWSEITDPDRRRSFFAAAEQLLEAENKTLDKPEEPSAQVEAPPPDRDDLTLIAGIDRQLARRLAGLGVRQYAQIAAWTHADVDRMSGALQTDDRIAREDWIGQARSLMPRFERCGECGHVYDKILLSVCPRHPPASLQPA
jgi:predicted flap endonuclease-1-like 5' DNA nuclease